MWSLCWFLPTPPTAARPVESRVNSREKHPQQVRSPFPLINTNSADPGAETNMCYPADSGFQVSTRQTVHMLLRPPTDKITADDVSLHTDDGKHATMEMRRILKQPCVEKRCLPPSCWPVVYLSKMNQYSAPNNCSDNKAPPSTKSVVLALPPLPLLPKKLNGKKEWVWRPCLEWCTLSCSAKLNKDQKYGSCIY